MKKFVTILLINAVTLLLCNAQVNQFSPINGTMTNSVFSMYAFGSKLYIGTQSTNAGNRLVYYNDSVNTISGYNGATNSGLGNTIIGIGTNDFGKIGIYDVNTGKTNIYFNALDTNTMGYSTPMTAVLQYWNTSPFNMMQTIFATIPKGPNSSYVGSFIHTPTAGKTAAEHTSGSFTQMGNNNWGAPSNISDMIWVGDGKFNDDTVYAIGNHIAYGKSLNYMPTSGVNNKTWTNVFQGSAFTAGDGVVELAAFEYYKGNFYIGAYCNQNPMTPHYKIFKWNPSNSTMTNVTPMTLNKIEDMYVFNDKLYVGGDKLLEFDNVTWASIAMIAGGEINTFAEYKNELYLGGTFTSVGGDTTMSHIAKMKTIYPPTASFNGNSSVCENGSITFTDNSTGDAITGYAWSFQGGNPGTSTLQNPGAVVFNNSGVYKIKLTVTNIAGSTSDSMFVTVNPKPTPNIIANGAIVFCQGDSVVLDAGTYNSYLWNTSQGSQNITANSSGTYVVTVTDANGCNGSDSVTVIVNNNPTPSITGILSFCQGDSTLLGTSVTYNQYSWSNGDTTQQTYASSVGYYKIIVTDANGCNGSDSVNISMNSLPPTPLITVAMPDLISSSSVNNQWILNGTDIPGATSQAYTPSVNGTYEVRVTDVNGCKSTSQPYNLMNVSIEELVDGYEKAYTVSNNTLYVNYKKEWYVYEYSGKLVKQGYGKDQINLTGMFILTNGITTHKIVLF